VPEFTVLARTTDHRDACSWPIEARDLDHAAMLAIAEIEAGADRADWFVAGIWQRDTPAAMLQHHGFAQEAAAELDVELDVLGTAERDPSAGDVNGRVPHRGRWSTKAPA
jgi:hypothetical protein